MINWKIAVQKTCINLPWSALSPAYKGTSRACLTPTSYEHRKSSAHIGVALCNISVRNIDCRYIDNGKENLQNIDKI